MTGARTWPFVLLEPEAQISLPPSALTPSATGRRAPAVGPPGGDLLQNSVRHRADEVGRDLDAVKLAQMPDDLAGAHAGAGSGGMVAVFSMWNLPSSRHQVQIEKPSRLVVSTTTPRKPYSRAGSWAGRTSRAIW